MLENTSLLWVQQLFLTLLFIFSFSQVEEFLRDYDNVCNLRLRMPISSDLNNSRNFIYKIAHYEKVVNIPNSMTVLDELFPLSNEMVERNFKEIRNFTNPGS